MTLSSNHSIITPKPYSRPQADKEPVFQFNPFIAFVFGAIFILGATVLFMFSARAVRFSFVPETAVVEITQGFPAWQWGDNLLMLPGDYHIKATAEGYYELDEALSVEDIEEQVFTFTLTKLPGILKVITDPPVEATVAVDGEPAGLSPLVIEEVSAGEHRISVTSERYQPAEQTIVMEGMNIRQEVTFALQPAWGVIHVSSTPENALVLVDDIEMGKTPLNSEIVQGLRRFQIKLKGYKTWNQEISVVAGEEVTLPDVNLKRADGSLVIRSAPNGASVTVSGRYHGETPVSIKLKPGSQYRVDVRKAGFGSQSRVVQIDSGEDMELDLQLKAIEGRIKISIKPVDAQLYVDGKRYGSVPSVLELSTTRHLLEFKKPGYASREEWVLPQQNFEQSLEIELLTEEEATLAAIPKFITTGQGQELKLIVPGKITLGARRNEPGRRSNEVIREIKLERLYYLGSKEVSNREFEAFNSSHDSGTWGRSALYGANLPVANVSWDQAVEYCNWLSEKDGLPKAYTRNGNSWTLIQPVNTGYRLPTEAEWAWAARMSPDSLYPFPWGKNLVPPKGAGNFADSSVIGQVPSALSDYSDGFRGTAPSGSFKPNALGIYDLAGNVSEWVNDLYSALPQPGLKIDFLGPDTGDSHVIRGSSFAHGNFSELRWAYRDFGLAARADTGFRIARYVE